MENVSIQGYFEDLHMYQAFLPRVVVEGAQTRQQLLTLAKVPVTNQSLIPPKVPQGTNEFIKPTHRA